MIWKVCRRMWVENVLVVGCGVLAAAGVPATVSAADSSTAPVGGHHVVGPEYQIDPALTDQGRPKGRQFEFSLPLAESRIFRGDDPTLEPAKKPVRKERRIFVYIPATYRNGTAAPVLVVHDGPGPLSLIRNALDNLIAPATERVRRLPAFVVVAVENGGSDSKNSQRGLEYDTMSDRLARFIDGEVLPAVTQNPEIRAAFPKFSLTRDPEGRAVMGCSSGGAAALTMAWFRPDLFRRVIAYSGTFVDQQDDDAPEEAMFPFGAWEYHSSKRLIETTDRKPLRIFTHVSENDNGAKNPEESHRNWVMAGERTAAALKSKGYPYRYVFSRASGHCESKIYEQTLADTLVWIWQGYGGY